MEKLTFDGNFCDIAQCWELPCPHGGSCTQRKVWEKLKAYEDTGLTPKLAQETAEFAIWVHENGLEKIKEWIKADKAGRLVVLKQCTSLYGTLGQIVTEFALCPSTVLGAATFAMLVSYAFMKYLASKNISETSARPYSSPARRRRKNWRK